ncbi:Glycosyltransferase involved in cell wall bisynthesis [Cohnella sp. OV330]|nr:Glycosyltransferase involved in cell wall bisynthesis [Cohnella sp. OV330]
MRILGATSKAIAVIAYELPSVRERTGGVSHFNHRLCNRLIEMGHRVTAYSVRTPDEVQDAAYRIETVAENASQGRLRRYYAAPLLGRKLSFDAYDLVLSSGDDWAMRRTGTPWVRIMHGSAWRELTHNKRALRKVNLLLQYALEQVSAARSDITLFNSRDTRGLYPKRKSDKVVHLPIDARRFSPGPKSDAPTLLFVGGLDSRKRGRWLLKLFNERIRPSIPEAQLWMVCDPSEEAPGVTYFRMVTQDQLADLYRQAHVFCMPSTYEGFGLPYLEAMASGTLVVTTPNPGAIELLAGGEYGRIVEDGALADALIESLLSPVNHGRWTVPALRWARNHDWSVLVDEFLLAGAGQVGVNTR